MSLQDGPVAVLSTIVVAGLAVGLGFGAHAVIGEADVDAGPSSGPSTSGIVLSDDFCTLMGDMVVYVDQFKEEMSGSLGNLAAEGQSEAETLDGLHEFGRVFVEITEALDAYLGHGAELMVDPDMAAAFVQLARETEALGRVLGTAALEAESTDAYALAMEAASSDTEFIAIVSEGDAAEPIVDAYVLATCGIDLSGATVDTDLQADVSTLAREIATYYVDWDEVTQPEITVSDDEYYLNGVPIGAQTPGVVLTDQFSLGADEWCVEVSSEDDPETLYSYSAMEGLQPVTCASLHP